MARGAEFAANIGELAMIGAADRLDRELMVRAIHFSNSVVGHC